MLNIFTPLWAALFGILAVAAIIDRAFVIGWGLADDLWFFLGFVAAAPCFWMFATMIHKFNLAYVRHTYGPGPTD